MFKFSSSIRTSFERLQHQLAALGWRVSGLHERATNSNVGASPCETYNCIPGIATSSDFSCPSLVSKPAAVIVWSTTAVRSWLMGSPSFISNVHQRDSLFKKVSSEKADNKSQGFRFELYRRQLQNLSNVFFVQDCVYYHL